MSGTEIVFSSTSYSANGLGYATAFTAIAVLFLGVVVAVRGRGSLISILFLSLTIGVTGWLGSFAFLYAALTDDVALFWGRAATAFAALIPPSVFHFAVAYGHRRQLRFAVFAGWLACGVIAITAILTSLHVPFVRHYPWGNYTGGTPWSLIWVAVYMALSVAGLRILWRCWKDAVGEARQRAKLLVIAFAIGFGSAIDLLPSLGINVLPLGFLFVLGFVAVTAMAILRFHLVDITPEYAAEQILETMKGAVVVVDLEGMMRVVNRAAAVMVGCDVKDLIGKHIRTIVERNDTMSTGQLLNSMGVLEQNMQWRTSSGALLDVLASSSFVRGADGMPVAVVYVASDITERRRNEQELRESEHRYRTLFEANPLPMWVYDYDTLQFLAVNDAAVQHYGWSRDEFLRMKITDLGDQPDARSAQHRKKDGSIIDAEIVSFEFLSGGVRSRLVIASDVTERRRSDELLRESEERYRSLVEAGPDAILVHSGGKITYANAATLKLLGAAAPDQLIGRNVIDLVHPDYREVVRERLSVLKAGSNVPMIEEKLIRLDGSVVDVEVTAIAFTFRGRPAVQVVARDVTERKAIEQRYRLLFERNLAGVYRTTLGGQILDCNDALARIFGYTDRNDLLDQTAVSVYFTPEERQKVLEELQERKTLSNVEVRMRRRDGSPLWVLESMTLLDGVIEGTIIDITDRKTAQERIEYQAYHDVLTGLPNRSLFRDRIAMALAHARRSGREIAVMFLDLDQFKLVNDTLGHTVGDHLLQVIGERLVACVRSEDTVARMGGDEFTILLPDIADERAASRVAQKSLDAVSQPVMIEGHELYVTTSIGIATYPVGGTDVETLTKNADRAMYRAKELGRNNFQFATSADSPEARLLLETSLLHAFEEKEFVVHYQPMIETDSGRVVGAEALVRWRHPDGRVLFPEEFLNVAEESRLIIPLGEWILRTACVQGKKWLEAGYPLRVAVNLSPRQFQQRDLTIMIENVLAETHFPADLLELEISESTAMQNPELATSIIRGLKELGVRISIDDFGTGYSSLSYLRKLPIDTVKIDQNFVRDLADPNSVEAAIVASVMSIARALHLRVVAEGVETEEQRASLERAECAEVQGYLYCRPVPPEEFELTLKKAERRTQSPN